MRSNSEGFIAVLRWIGVLPGAIAAAVAAYYVSWIVLSLSLLWSGINPTGLHGRAILYAFSSMAIGGAFVASGWQHIAPYHKKGTAYALAALGLVTTGMGIAVVIMTEEFWVIWPLTWQAASAGFMAYAISEGAEPNF